jgi:hypothetical protein
MNNKIKWRVYGNQSITAHLNELSDRYDVPLPLSEKMELAKQLMKKFREIEFNIEFDDRGKIVNVEWIP